MEKMLCIELEKIKRENPECYEKILKFYSYIYKTIKEDYYDYLIKFYHTENEIYTSGKSIRFSQYSNIEEKYKGQRDLLFNQFVENPSGIEKNFFDMLSFSDRRFLDYFLEKISIPIDLIQRNVLSIKSYYLYNIYTMLVAYEKNKEDFDTFKKVLDDISYLFIQPNPEDEKDNYLTFLKRINKNEIDKRNLIRNVLGSSFYKSSEDLQKFLKTLLTDFRITYKDGYNSQLRKMFDLLEKLEGDLRKFNKVGQKIEPQVVEKVVEDLTLYIHDDLLPGVVPFYDKVLLFGDRFQTLKEQIKVVDPYLREDVLKYFKNLNIYMFENKDGKDLFCEYVKMIFDSDTYHELFDKLKKLQTASSEYSKGNTQLAACLLDSFSSGNMQFKQTFAGIIIRYPISNINKIEKPITIGERMKELYKQNDLLPINSETSFVSKGDTNLEVFVERISNNMMDYYHSKLSRREEVKPEPKKEEPPVKKKTKFSIFG